MEKLSNEVIAKGVLDHLTNVMRKWKNNPSFVLPNLKQILVTRWHSDPLFLVSFLVIMVHPWFFLENNIVLSIIRKPT
jgi:hypothetical protein